jgi:hypothetical protein
MPDQKTIKRARRDATQGKSPSTQAGEFVREEIEHVRKGKHGARSAKQAIAIGLSKARRAGVKVPSPNPTKSSPATRKKARRDSEAVAKSKPSAKRSRATSGALKRESRKSASTEALSTQAHSVAKGRTRRARSAIARTAATTSASETGG